MNSIVEIIKFFSIVTQGIFVYYYYGPPCKSWDLKTWIFVHIFRSSVNFDEGLPATREKIKQASTSQVNNSKLKEFSILDKFRERAHDLVKEHLGKVYGEDSWYGEESHWSNTPHLRPEWLIPNHSVLSSNSRVILYIYGGGYSFGHFSMHRACLETLAQNTDSIVLGASYRLSPEYSAPCQLEDALAHILYLTSPVEDSGIGLSFNQIIVSGDSAGGGLSSVLNHFMRDAKIGRLAGSLLYSPWIDLTTGQPSCIECTDTDVLPRFEHGTYDLDEKGKIIPGLFNSLYQASDLKIQNKMIERGHFLAPKKYVNSPLISPLCDTNFKKLPPTLIITGQVELLRDESILYHELINNSYSEEELSEFKVPPTTLHLYEEMFHVFPMTVPNLVSSQISFKRAINFIKQCFTQSSDGFSKVQAENPINLGADKDASNLVTLKQWRNLYLSTASDHSLIPFTPNYKRVNIQTWIKIN
jgi:acetyl esterase/lipase